MSDTTFIYVLRDPADGAVRYVGKSHDPEWRLGKHIVASRRKKHHLACWIRKLVKLGMEPKLEIIDEVSVEHWPMLEVAYIDFYKEQGCNLLNITMGGNGTGKGKDHPSFGKHLSEETRRKMSISRMGRPFSNKMREALRIANTGRSLGPEHRLNISLGNKGRVRTQETRDRIGRAVKQRWLDPEARKAMTIPSGEDNPAFGKPKSPETKAKISAGNKGKHTGPLSKKHCNAISVARKGIRFSDEHRAAISAVVRATWAKRKEREWVEECISELWN